MVGTVLLPNIIAIVLLMVLMVSANNVSRNKMMPDSKIFYLMVSCNLMQCIGEMTAYAIDGKMYFGFHVLGLIINAMLYITNVFFAYLWVIYADYRIFEDKSRIRARGLKLMIPALAIMLGSVINLFVPVFFSITPDNIYQRTSLFPLPFAITYLYLAYGTIFIYRHKNQARKYVFLPATLFMMPILMGSIVQYISYGMSTVWIGVAIALTAVYINVQNEISYIDALSGVYTRVYMYRYLDSLIHKQHDDRKIGGIMLDIDDFKQINDTQGHLVGDDAIRAAGNILHDALSDMGIAARYGGDEFVVLQEIRSEADIYRTVERIKKAEEVFNAAGRNYRLRFSMGVGVMDVEQDTVDSFMERMDRAMYEAKKKRKLENESKGSIPF